MHRGYIPVWRKFFEEHPFWKEKRKFSKAEAWLDILKEAQFEETPKQVLFGMRVIVQNYGEVLRSVRGWAKRWRWTEAATHRFLNLLKKMEQIDTQSEVVTTRITVLNYSKYDLRCNTLDNAVETGAEQERNRSDRQLKSLKNDKKKKKVKKIFIPPTLDDVKEYFEKNGYTNAKKAFNYYSTGNWHDGKGDPVKNWKQKMIAVWFKPENKIQQAGGFKEWIPPLD